MCRKASFFRAGRGAQVGNLHLKVNFGASFDVRRMIFYGTLQALLGGIPQPSI
eukprot:UN26141